MVKPTFLNLPDEKRAQIEEAATDEFARLPYAKASLSRIVERVGIAKGSMYQYFANKLDLYQWLMEQAAHKKMEYFGGQITPEPGHFFEWLESAFSQGLRFALDHPRIARLSLLAMNSQDPQLRSLGKGWRRAGLEYSQKLFKEAQLHGEIRDDLDPRTLSVLLASVQNSLLDMLCVMAGVDEPEDLFKGDAKKKLSDDEIEKVVAQLIEVFKRGVANPDGPSVVEGAPRVEQFNLKDALSRANADHEGGSE